MANFAQKYQACRRACALSVSDVLALTYGDIHYEFERGATPLCLDLVRIKTDVPHMTFIGTWGVNLLKQHLARRRLDPKDPIYVKTRRVIDNYFEKLGRRFVGPYRGSNPCRPHSLRAAFRTLLSDHKVDPHTLSFGWATGYPNRNGFTSASPGEGAGGTMADPKHHLSVHIRKMKGPRAMKTPLSDSFKKH